MMQGKRIRSPIVIIKAGRKRATPLNTSFNGTLSATPATT
jgi:hypothetical protein